jgi:hypothetical protein
VLIAPDGQIIDAPVQPLFLKYFHSLLTQITCLLSPSCPTEGRLAIVTNAGQDAVDANGALTKALGCGR